MTAQIIPFPVERRTVARVQCEAVTMTETVACNYIRWWAAATRDWLRTCWGV